MCSLLVIVAAALHMACVIQQKDAKQWFAELAVDLEKVWICLFFQLFFRNVFILHDIIVFFRWKRLYSF